MTDKALDKKRDIVEETAIRVKELETKGDIVFPPDYIPQNALKAAWLVLQETRDRNKKLVLESCSKTSIAMALLDTVIQGLNPAKKQVYYIAYGDRLTAVRSYHGSMALAKQVDAEVGEIVAEVVYEKDTFNYSIDRGIKKILHHEQSLGNVDSKKIIAAYCTVLDKNGEVRFNEIMTWEEVKKSWGKSQLAPVTKEGNIKSGTTHADFTAEMAKRTVINRACKRIINSSNDKTLVEAAGRADMVAAEYTSEEDIEAHAMQEPIDVLPEETPEPEPTQEQEPQEYSCPLCSCVAPEPYCAECKKDIPTQGELL